MATRILVTGANGFVGAYLLVALRQRWPDAAILGLRGAKPDDAKPDGAKPDDATKTAEPHAYVDLLDFDSVAGTVAAFGPDLVIHLAAQSSVARGEAASASTWKVNLAGSLALGLAVAAYAPTATVLFASSSEVYGASFRDSPLDENATPRPLNAYARSKLAAERMLADVLPATCRLIVARPFNHTGPGQLPHFVLPSIVAQIVAMERGDRPPRLAVGNLDVHRDFLDVRDVVAAYVALCEAAPKLPGRFTVNIASGIPRRLDDLVSKLKALASLAFEITVDPERVRPVDLPIVFAKPELLVSQTGWAPRISIDETLRDLMEHARRSGA